MIFDAIINLFKTICIGVIAFSPLLVYKALDEPSSRIGLNGNAPTINYDLEGYQQAERSSEENKGDSTVQSTGIFENTGIFGQTAAPPPPPPPPVDAPIDSEIWVLIASGILFGLYSIGRRAGWDFSSKEHDITR